MSFVPLLPSDWFRFRVFLTNSPFHSRKWRVQPWSSRVSIGHTENTRDSRKVEERRPSFRIASEVTERGGAHHIDGEKRDSARDKRHATCKKPPIGNITGFVCPSAVLKYNISFCMSVSACLPVNWSVSLSVGRCLSVSRSLSVRRCLSVSQCLSHSVSVSQCLSVIRCLSVSRSLSVSQSLCQSVSVSWFSYFKFRYCNNECDVMEM